jgi:lysophospholipase L1-like esterase
MKIKNGMKILFQGDSITDCGRNRETGGLGGGYPSMVAGLFKARNPGVEVTFINKGISGNRVVDLQGRWQEDCIDLAPDVVSILIGINDTWRRYDSGNPTSARDYETGYRSILSKVKALGAQILILEPFVLPYPEDRKSWREDLDPKIAAAKRLAGEFGAEYIPLDSLFAEAAKAYPPEFWAGDGVHPSAVGHALIADAWLKTVYELPTSS